MTIKNSLLFALIAIAAISAISFDAPKTTEIYAQSATTLNSGVSITIDDGTGGGGPGVKNPASITFSGLAYPDALVTIFRNEVVIGTTSARTDGTFTQTLTVDQGFITFGLQARDTGGLTSSITEITINVKANSKIGISSIFLSPTITADKFNLQKGGTLRIFGSAFPNSIVRLFNNLAADETPVSEITTSATGLWEYFFPTDDLNDGQYSLKVNAQVEDPFLVSDFSKNLEFTIAEISCAGADFNFDTRVNIVDFSILIFYWERNPAIGAITNICTDLNVDELVDIFDFSILMHQWTN